MNEYVLDEDLMSLREMLDSYQREKLFHVQRRRNLLRTASNAGGGYNVNRLLNAQMQDQTRNLAPFELAESERLAEEYGKPPEPGFCYVPYSRRDLTAGVASAGGYLTGLETAPGDIFVKAALAASITQAMGISRLSMTGQASFPRTSGVISTGWLQTEGTALTESQFTFAVSTGTPKHVGAYCEVSDQWLKQTSQPAQNFVLGQLAAATAAEMDGKIIAGSGASGQPLGILSATGIGSVTGTSLAYTGALDILKSVEDASALIAPDQAAWAVAPDVARLLRARQQFTGSSIAIMDNNRIAGYRAFPSKNVPAQALLFGDWSGAVILEWGQLQIGADPYGVNSALFQKGLVGLRAIWTVDVVVLRPASFCKSESIT